MYVEVESGAAVGSVALTSTVKKQSSGVSNVVILALCIYGRAPQTVVEESSTRPVRKYAGDHSCCRSGFLGAPSRKMREGRSRVDLSLKNHKRGLHCGSQKHLPRVAVRTKRIGCGTGNRSCR